MRMRFLATLVALLAIGAGALLVFGGPPGAAQGWIPPVEPSPIAGLMLIATGLLILSRRPSRVRYVLD